MDYAPCVKISVGHIELSNFMSHAATTIDLPKRGVVTVRGSNGVGKSSIAEAVSYGGWGRTLRDSNPWRSGEAGSVRLRLDGFQRGGEEKSLWVVRSISKDGIKKLRWWWVDEDETRFGTNTKAQEGLDAIIGTWEMWRRTHVLSSQDVAGFSSATNAEKCKLLESMLGLERFDKARELASEAASLHTRLRLKLHSDKSQAESLVREHETLLRAHKAQLASAMDLPVVEAPDPVLVEVQERLAVTLSDRETGLVDALSALKSQFAHASAELLRATTGKCSQCGTAFVHTDEQLAQMGAEVKAARTAIAYSEEALKMLRVDKASARQQLSKLYQELEQAKASHGTVKMQNDLRGKIQIVSSQLIDAQDALEACLSSLAKSQQDSEAAMLAVKSLSVGGARSHILRQAIKHVEASANSWMLRLSPNLSVTVSPYTEGASGVIRNEISIGVIGAGGENGYAGCSGGERRMIDTVLMLALGDASAAAHGSGVGSMWLDEVFDSLDSQKAASFESLIQDLAADRVCVFISHTHQISGTKNFIVRRTPTGAVVE